MTDNHLSMSESVPRVLEKDRAVQMSKDITPEG